MVFMLFGARGQSLRTGPVKKKATTCIDLADFNTFVVNQLNCDCSLAEMTD